MLARFMRAEAGEKFDAINQLRKLHFLDGANVSPDLNNVRRGDDVDVVFRADAYRLAIVGNDRPLSRLGDG